MAKNKRTPTERTRDLERIAELYLKGKRQAEIAVEIGVTQPQISYDLEEIRTRWRESTLVNINEAMQRELARIDLLECEFWEAWRRSCTEKIKTRTKRWSISGETEASVEKDQMLGNPAFLAGVEWCIEQRCKIFGLYAPTKNDVRFGEVDVTKLTDEELDAIIQR